MSEDTSVARAVRSVADDYDAACKRLLSEKQILARILHDYVDEFSDVSPQEIAQSYFVGEPRIGEDPVDRDAHAERVQALTNEDKTVAEGTVTFDIRFDAWAPSPKNNDGKDLVRVEIDVEAQNNYHPGYPLLKRAVFYGGRMLSMQGGSIVERSHYERIRKVVTIWVCAHPPVKYAGTVTTFGITPTQRVGKAKFAQNDFDLIELVLMCLNSGEPGKSEGALGMLEILLATGIEAQKKLLILHEKYGIIVSEDLSERVKAMCNLSVGAIEEGYVQGMNDGWKEGHEKGWKEGRAEGREQGRAEGRAEGRDNERAAFLRATAAMVRDGLLALSLASERFGFSEQEIRAAL